MKKFPIYKPEKIKGKDAKEKIVNFFYYYKWAVVIGIVLIVCLISFISNRVTAKSDVFVAEIINAKNTDMEAELNAGLPEYLGIDTDKEDAYIASGLEISTDPDSYSYMDYSFENRLIANINAGTFDVLISDEAFYTLYADDGLYADLTEYLDEDVLEKYESTDSVLYDSSGSPVAIKADVLSALMDYGFYEESDAPVFTIVYSTDANKEYFNLFLEFLSK